MDGLHRQSRDNLSGGRAVLQVCPPRLSPAAVWGILRRNHFIRQYESGIGVLVCLCRDKKYYGLSNGILKKRTASLRMRI